MPAGILIPASWTHVAYGSDHPSTRNVHHPVRSAETTALQRLSPGLSHVIATGWSSPSGSVSTTVALTASCPSRKTVAKTVNSSSTTDLAGRSPPSTRGQTPVTGIRPKGTAPPAIPSTVGGTLGVAGEAALEVVESGPVEAEDVGVGTGMGARGSAGEPVTT